MSELRERILSFASSFGSFRTEHYFQHHPDDDRTTVYRMLEKLCDDRALVRRKTNTGVREISWTYHKAVVAGCRKWYECDSCNKGCKAFRPISDPPKSCYYDHREPAAWRMIQEASP